MKTYISRIKGKDYLYAYDKITIAKGRTIPKTKSLGNLRIPAEIAKKKRAFTEQLIAEEAKLRFDYWQSRINDKKFTKYASIAKTEELRARLYRGKAALGDTCKAAMETAFLVDFIFNSNKIEGSKVPRESVEKIVEKGGRKNEEVGNTIRAVNFTDNRFKFNIRNILELHRILLQHEPSKHGLRKEKVVVYNQDVMPWEMIKPELKELLTWYEKAKRNWHAPELAFAFHYRFERIHPFLDGNGRVGRLLMNKILKENHYHPIIIWNNHFESFKSAFRKATAGRKEDYYKFMADEMAHTYDIYIHKIQKAEDLDEKVRFFMQPSR